MDYPPGSPLPSNLSNRRDLFLQISLNIISQNHILNTVLIKKRGEEKTRTEIGMMESNLEDSKHRCVTLNSKDQLAVLHLHDQTSDLQHKFTL